MLPGQTKGPSQRRARPLGGGRSVGPWYRSPVPAATPPSELEARVRARPLPRHVAVIMDGNGRWAEARGLPRVAGHREGAEAVRAVVRTARRIGLPALTLYAFSMQNWARPADEVAALMALLGEFLRSERGDIRENAIRLNAIGDLARLPPEVKAQLDLVMGESRGNGGMVLTLALSYGGRESIARAVRTVAEDVAAGRLAPADIDADRLGGYLPTARLPPLDLLVRTSGEQRISNFMLWELAYAELVFVDCMWPDFRRAQLYAVLEQYAARERRFGLISSQLGADDSDVE